MFTRLPKELSSSTPLFLLLLETSSDLQGVTNGLCEHAEHCDFFASTSRNKKLALRACEQWQKFREHEQASTRFNFASKLSEGKILRAVKNFNGPFITSPSGNKTLLKIRF